MSRLRFCAERLSGTRVNGEALPTSLNHYPAGFADSSGTVARGGRRAFLTARSMSFGSDSRTREVTGLAPGRGTTTTSTAAGSSCCSPRNASRMARFHACRTTEFPRRFPTLVPSRVGPSARRDTNTSSTASPAECFWPNTDSYSFGVCIRWWGRNRNSGSVIAKSLCRSTDPSRRGGGC